MLWISQMYFILLKCIFCNTMLNGRSTLASDGFAVNRQLQFHFDSLTYLKSIYTSQCFPGFCQQCFPLSNFSLILSIWIKTRQILINLKMFKYKYMSPLKKKKKKKGYKLWCCQPRICENLLKTCFKVNMFMEINKANTSQDNGVMFVQASLHYTLFLLLSIYLVSYIIFAYD